MILVCFAKERARKAAKVTCFTKLGTARHEGSLNPEKACPASPLPLLTVLVPNPHRCSRGESTDVKDLNEHMGRL